MEEEKELIQICWVQICYFVVEVGGSILILLSANVQIFPVSRL